MKKTGIIAGIILLIVFVVFFSNENKNYSKNELVGVREIASGLYRETYRVYGGGVYGGDVYTVYLTDSVSFRKYIESISDHEQIGFDFVDKDHVETFKLNFDKISENLKPLPPDTTKRRSYSLIKLRNESKWE